MKSFGILVLAVVFASLAFSEEIKTTTGKVYKNATVSRVEGDGLVLKTEKGIVKVYFTELPQDVQERFHWVQPQPPRQPFYRQLATAAAAQDPAALAKIIAVGSSVIASVMLVIRYIRSRRKPTPRIQRRRALDRSR